MQEIKQYISDCEQAIHDIEASYFDANSNTWDILNDLFFEHHGIHPHPKFDLLDWFKRKFHWHDDQWVHIDDLSIN